MGELVVRSGTLSCGGAGGQNGQQALPLQVEEMLLLHLQELLLDGDLLCRQLSHREREREMGRGRERERLKSPSIKVSSSNLRFMSISVKGCVFTQDIYSLKAMTG